MTDRLPDATRFYVGGAWGAPSARVCIPLVDPSTEEPFAEVALGEAEDIDRAVRAARTAFDSYSRWPVSDRIALLEQINARLVERNDEIAAAISREMGAPAALARNAQATSGAQHFAAAIRVLRTFAFEEVMGSALVRREAIGVCGLITPWNWPMNQVAVKVAPALAAGCTVVLKPSELAPLDAVILAEIIDEAGAPPGVFNLVHGDGPGAGAALAAHPDVDMVSFTGSKRGGLAVSHAAAPTFKRVTLELGGKSASIVLDDADLESAVAGTVDALMTNSGQSCNAPSRLLVPDARYEEAAARAVEAANAITLGAPESGSWMGPVANKGQYERVVQMIETGLEEGAVILAGGPGRPPDLNRGYFVQPTVFGSVTQDMRIAREEIFGPVLTLLAYRDLDAAVAMANESEYGLSGAIWSSNPARAMDVATRLRTGMVHINGAPLETAAPFGGYKQSGNGREWGRVGFEEFLEYKSVYGGAGA